MVGDMIAGFIQSIIETFVDGAGWLILRIAGVKEPSKYGYWGTIIGVVFWVIAFIAVFLLLR